MSSEKIFYNGEWVDVHPVTNNTDLNAVHKTGDEEISGHKVISNKLVQSDNSTVTGILTRVPDFTRGDTQDHIVYSAFEFCDRNAEPLDIGPVDHRLGSIVNKVETNGTVSTTIAAYRNTVANGSVNLGVVFPLPENGTPYAVCPTPATNSNTNHIATTEWVNSKCVIKKGDSDIIIQSPTYIHGQVPSKHYHRNLYWYDKDGTQLGKFRFEMMPIGDSRITIGAKSPVKDSTGVVDFTIVYPAKTIVDGVVTEHGDGHTQGPTCLPTFDNTYTIGRAVNRWKQLYAATTTIATSDERVKTSIEPITDAVLDAWADVDWYQFQMKDAVDEKGTDKARLHTGVIAQRIKSAFEAHGLDATKYGLLCYDEWEAEEAIYREEDDGTQTLEHPAKPAGNMYSVRYEECLCVEAAYQRRRADRIEARLAAIEEKLNVANS